MLQVAEGTDDDLDHWEKILNGKDVSEKEWKQFLEGRGFRSGVDYPISHHFEYVSNKIKRNAILIKFEKYSIE